MCIIEEEEEIYIEEEIFLPSEDLLVYVGLSPVSANLAEQTNKQKPNKKLGDNYEVSMAILDVFHSSVVPPAFMTCFCLSF